MAEIRAWKSGAPEREDAPGYHNRNWKARAVQRQIHEKINEKRIRLATLFGEQHGWKQSKSSFSLKVLARGKVHSGRDYNDFHFQGFTLTTIDHPYFYRTPTRRAAAIAAHLYDATRPKDEIELKEWAEKIGLVATFPNFPSWWYPENTRLVVYTGPAG
jgi:hypothetical protein